MEFDEEKAVEFINSYLKEKSGKSYPADEILNVIDMIWDYYEENGLLDIDADDDEESITNDEIIDYVTRMIKKDKGASIDVNDIPTLVAAELAYEESIDED
ncbi:MAG: hypothetical protein K2J06_02495 [Muribaculaceae bacterium]|nr:hypothetical protein [Muribaculaceae bacterium]